MKLANPEKHFEMLIWFFFQFYDPTTKNRQGNDRGSQYASCIFSLDEKRMNITRKGISKLQDYIDARRII